MGTDLLYYIMDYSSNYYRVNKADQLVVAEGEEEATVFTFTQANSRICVGKKSSFYCMVPIEESDTIEKSSEISEECKTENEEDEITTSDKVENVYVSPVKELTYDEIQEPVEKNVYSYDLSEMDWAEYLTHFTYVASAVKDYRDELTKKLSDMDQKICDILHYIELCETDDEEAIDLVELLRVCRENRRGIKDELMRTEYFHNNLGTSANVAKAKQALKSIEGLKKRKYKPRKYDELFENCIKKDRRREKADINAAGTVIENRKMEYSTMRTVKNEGGEDMIAEEKYTPYDGRGNDWLAFARQQAEFYRNAGQYITNLQITIRELDQEIEEILQGTEEANCNVAQGYKVYKRLKELRLERKAKAQELNCLYALTNHTDCDTLADTYESNLAEIEDIMNVTDNSITLKNVIENQIAGNLPEEIHVGENIQDMVG